MQRLRLPSLVAVLSVPFLLACSDTPSNTNPDLLGAPDLAGSTATAKVRIACVA